jgi:hypothetical protein
MKRIDDKFATLPVSRQRKYQMRKTEAGLCLGCWKQKAGAEFCLACWVKDRERQRLYLGYGRRNLNSRSYRLERESNEPNEKS